MKTRTELLQGITKIVSEILVLPDLVMTEATTASDVPGWDSLSHVQIIIAIERQFGFRFSFSEVSQLENAGGLIDQIIKKTGEA